MLMRSYGHWPLLIFSSLSRDGYWAWYVFELLVWPGLFRGVDGNVQTGMTRCGKWVCHMVVS